MPAAGISANSGPKKVAIANNIPHTSVLNPVLAPALIPAADSGLMMIGGPLLNPEKIVATPHTTNSHLPRGIVPSSFVRWARSDMDRERPLRVRI